MEVRQSVLFSRWFSGLRDQRAQRRIQSRIDRLETGNFGDVKSLGGGLSEIRLDYGPGYRIYFVRRGPTLIILLAGGDKSTQDRDIAAARRVAQTI
jgi:putative addiction module killer protein